MKRLLQILRGYMEDMGRRYTLVLLDVDFFSAVLRPLFLCGMCADHEGHQRVSDGCFR